MELTETETHFRVTDHYRTDDIDLLRNRYHAAPIDFLQVDPGSLGARVNAVATPKLELREARFDSGILNIIERPIDRFGIALGVSGNPQLFGTTLTSSNLAYINGRNGVFARLPAGGGWLNLTMDQAWLREVAAVHDYAIPSGDNSIGLPTAKRNALIFKLGRIASQKECTTFSDEQLEDALALLVLRELNAMTGRRATLNPGSCWAVVHEVVDYIHANYAEPMTLTKLCQLVNVSERTLRYHFLKATGLNPQQYLSNYRLHRAHALLVENRVAEVADAARACGIPHTGRFSQYFKAMFGEFPSQVLRRPARTYREPKAL